MRVLSEFAREELRWHSPFEICYGPVSNFVKKFNIDTDATVEQESVNPRVPSDTEIKKNFKVHKKDTSKI